MEGVHPRLRRPSAILGPFLAAATGLAVSCSAARPTESPEEAQTHYEAALRAYRAADYDRAMSELDAAIAAWSGFGEAYLLRGKTRMRRIDASNAPGPQETEAAIEDFTRASKVLPMVSDIYYHRAVALASLARFRDAARDLLDYCLKLAPNDRDAVLLLARVYDRGFEGKEADALRYYEQYLSLGGRDPEAQRRRAELSRLGKTSAAPDALDAEAKALFQKALKARAEGNDEAAKSALTELLSRYGQTAFVKKFEKTIADLLRSVTGEKK